MTNDSSNPQATPAKPVLLFNDECSVCRRIANWVKKYAKTNSSEPSIIVRPIGEDPEALRLLSPGLSIWDAYATIHLVMADGQLKLGGEAVAEVFRNLPITSWLARSFSVNIFGFRPFQKVLNMAYAVLSDVRPIFGCESCGAVKLWVRPLHLTLGWIKRTLGRSTAKSRPITSIPVSRRPIGPAR
jgi:predicted DCC family thiol-disulfide oxidoreductase YuxK